MSRKHPILQHLGHERNERRHVSIEANALPYPSATILRTADTVAVARQQAKE